MQQPGLCPRQAVKGSPGLWATPTYTVCNLPTLKKAKANEEEGTGVTPSFHNWPDTENITTGTESKAHAIAGFFSTILKRCGRKENQVFPAMSVVHHTSTTQQKHTCKRGQYCYLISPPWSSLSSLGESNCETNMANSQIKPIFS